MSPSIDWWSPRVGPAEYGLVEAVLRSNYINEGEVTTSFEKHLANLLGAKHAVAVSSGTAAIFLALAGLGIGPGDEVVVPDVTFIATANAVALAGARPVLVDVDPQTLNLSVAAFERAITPRTKAVVPVHVSGRAADMPAIVEIARRHGLVVVEDAAEALLSRRFGRRLGTFGNAGCFSFSPNKTITTGQGGLVVTDDDTLHVRLRELKDQGRPVRGTGGDDLHNSVGYNFKLTNLQAAVGMGQLGYLEERLARQRRHYEVYREELSGLRDLSLIQFHLEDGEQPQWVDCLVGRRDELDGYLRERGIGCRRYWFPLHTQAPFKLTDADFPDSTRLARQALWLPSAFTLSDEDIVTVCRHIRAFFEIG